MLDLNFFRAFRDLSCDSWSNVLFLSPQSLIRQPDLPRHPVELFSGWFDRPIRLDPEGIAGVTREDVQVNVRDLLKGGFSIGQEEIDPLTPHAALAGLFPATIWQKMHLSMGYLQLFQENYIPLTDPDNCAILLAFTRT